MKERNTRIATLFILMLLALPASASHFESIFVNDIEFFASGGVKATHSVTVQNNTDEDIDVSGRLILLNVYSFEPPTSIQTGTMVVPARDVLTFVIPWADPPLFGKVRGLLLLTDGDSHVTSFEYWVIPWLELILVLSSAALLFFLAHLFFHVGVFKRFTKKEGTEKETKKPKKKRKPKKRVPAGMVLHTVEVDDTVVTIAERFGVTWEDVVRANRLKPPYDLKKGTDIFIPKHKINHSKDE